eukprot:2872535-Rhodomonas_salina.1
MANEQVRDSFLSAVLLTSVQNSAMLSDRRNPVAKYDEVGEWVQSSNKTLVALSGKEVEVSLVQNGDSIRSDEATEVLRGLISLREDLNDLLPMNERGSVLDLICETQNSVINVLVQIEPMNAWDFRIQHHAY